MKKLILLLSLITLFCQSTLAQTGGLNFQGIARNATGAVLANQKINLKFSILKITETGAVEYTETKEATTNAQGIFAVVVGEVNATSFAAVDWKVTPKFLKVEMDPAGGTSFVAMGTTRLQNVPFAYYANGVNANNIDGAVPVSKGGTGATDAAAARTNLGLVIGTNVQAPLIAGTDYLTPTGNAASATKLATKKKINGVDFDGTSDITIPTNADASSLSGTVSIAKGGTGAATAADARANLGLVIGTNVQAPLTAGTDYLTPTGNAATATKLAAKKKINGVDFDGSNDITIPTAADASTLSGTVSIAKGGTGATSAADARANLGAESIANKSTDITVDAASLTKYPSVKTIKDYVDTRVITGVSTSTDLTITSVNGLELGRGAGSNTKNVAVGASALYRNTTGINNTASGYNSLLSNTTGNGNTASGFFSLQSNTAGGNNTAIGTTALFSNTTGGYNTASGAGALGSNTIGSYNTSSGIGALSSNTTGWHNTASGVNALMFNTLGWYNTAIGNSALLNNTTGGYNTAIGNNALYSNTTGLQNTAIGHQAGSIVTTGANNTFIGVNSNASSGTVSNTTAIGNGATVSASNTIQLGNNAITDVKTAGTITAAGYKIPNGTSSQYLMADGTVSTGVANTTSFNGLELGKGTGNNSSNVAVGTRALLNNTTGVNNTASGADALSSNITGFNNTASGYLALYSNTTGYHNTASGADALRGNTTGNDNTAIGADALQSNTTGGQNTATGYLALYSNTTGYHNTATGRGALQNNTTGYSNIASGMSALLYNTEGVNNTAIGNSALLSNTWGGQNVAIGNEALYSNTISSQNTAIGYRAMRYVDNGNPGRIIGNTAIGYESLRGSMTPANNTGLNNTALGYQAVFSNTTGNYNTASGYSALYSNTTGGQNTASGYNALYRNSTGYSNTAIGFSALEFNITGGGNTAIGYQAGITNLTGQNNTFIGNGSGGSSENVSNSINLGNSSITTLRAQVTSITSLSDRRDKTDIVNISEGLDFLKQLRPVSFTWNTRDKAKVGIKSAGFIAQELLALQKGSNIGDNLDLVSQDNPEKLEARYNNLLPVIVKAIQEVNEAKDKELGQLKAEKDKEISELRDAKIKDKAEKDKEISELKARIQSLEVLIKKVLEAKKP